MAQVLELERQENGSFGVSEETTTLAVPFEDRVERIIELEAEADDLENRADDARWEAARLIYEEVAAGKSIGRLSKQVEKSHTHVSRMRRVWENWLQQQIQFPEVERPLITDAYEEAKNKAQVEHVPHGQAETQVSDPGEDVIDGEVIEGEFIDDEPEPFDRIGTFKQVVQTFDPTDASAGELRDLLTEVEVLVENLRGWIEEAEA